LKNTYSWPVLMWGNMPVKTVNIQDFAFFHPYSKK